MIKISGNDILRGGEKLGWLEGNDIYGEDGGKLGYYSGDDIYNSAGVKIGYLEGMHLKTTSGRTVLIEELRRHIFGTVSDIARAAVYLLFEE
jgi:hypothetical protein